MQDDENGNGGQDIDSQALPPPENEIDMYVEEDRITFIPRRLHGIPVNEQDIIDSVAEELDTTPIPTKPPMQPTTPQTGILPFGVFLVFICIMSIMVQLYFIVNPLTVTVTFTSATPARRVTLSFSSVSTWINALSSADQQHIKNIIVGKNTVKALQLLHSLPGIENVSLQFAGFGDDTRIPKNIMNIHLAIFYGL